MISAPQFFRALADRTRLRWSTCWLTARSASATSSACSSQPQSSVSRHLALLKSAGLIRGSPRRDAHVLRPDGVGLARWRGRCSRPSAPTLAARRLRGPTSRNCCGCERRASATRNRRPRPRGWSPADLGPGGANDPSSVLFACVHNAGRSQMAAAFFNSLADPEEGACAVRRHEAGRGGDPEVVRDARGWHRPVVGHAAVADDRFGPAGQHADHHGLRRRVPVLPGVERDDWALPDRRGDRSRRSAPFATTFAHASRR